MAIVEDYIFGIVSLSGDYVTNMHTHMLHNYVIIFFGRCMLVAYWTLSYLVHTSGSVICGLLFQYETGLMIYNNHTHATWLSSI